ncbi:MAG: fumarylacetoacetate hydrolase family protein [Acidimicrobiales bacterium]
MKLATIRTATGHVAVRVEGLEAVELGVEDLGCLLAQPDWVERANSAQGRRHHTEDVDYAPVVPNPPKVFCVGLNYRLHIAELGLRAPEYPTLFAKFASSLIGAYDDIVLPTVSTSVDWEAELGVVIGSPARRVSLDQAGAAIAGYTVVNDISMRDWQWRTSEWLQGKAFEASTPVGPWLVTPDEVGNGADLELRCEVDGEVRQRFRTSDMVFSPAEVVSYISQFTTLVPGDLISTGTPGGVGMSRDPKVFLEPGQVVRTSVEGLGECRNHCVAEKD